MQRRTRQETILKLLRQDGEKTIRQLAAFFDVSEMTIRRDLDSMAAEGKVLRTHGGAAPADKVSFEFQFLQRVRERQYEKQVIAAAVAELVAPGSTVMLDSGTTTLAVAQTLTDRPLTVITTSLPIAGALHFVAPVDVLLLGGWLKSDAPDLGGPLTEQNLERLHADLAIVGADGIDDRGRVYNHSLTVARMLSRMVEAADRVVVVADHSKLNRKALSMFGRLPDWDALVTDSKADPSFIARLARHGTRVILAP